jgi:dihydrofolate reductase
MSNVVCDISVSADGYSAGHNQTEERPFGDGDLSMLHSWMFDTAEENQPELEAIIDAKAFVMGRNMFGPIRGEWSGDWTGWWGPEPPYHAPVFVLTHYEREPVVLDGGTTFHFLATGLLDELRLHIAPFTLGSGTRVFDGVPPLKLEQVSSRPASLVTHVTYRMAR